jgi:hypothetical protein
MSAGVQLAEDCLLSAFLLRVLRGDRVSRHEEPQMIADDCQDYPASLAIHRAAKMRPLSIIERQASQGDNYGNCSP